MANPYYATELLWHTKHNHYVQPGEPFDVSDHSQDEVATAEKLGLLTKVQPNAAQPEPKVPELPEHESPLGEG